MPFLLKTDQLKCFVSQNGIENPLDDSKKVGSEVNEEINIVMPHIQSSRQNFNIQTANDVL